MSEPGRPTGRRTVSRRRICAALSSGSASERARTADPLCVKDNSWLLFPLRLAGDFAAKPAEDPTPAALPIGFGRTRRVAVTCPADEGYTPGDVYELHLDSEDRILQWVYREAGAPSPTRVTSWKTGGRWSRWRSPLTAAAPAAYSGAGSRTSRSGRQAPPAGFPPDPEAPRKGKTPCSTTSC